MAGQALGGQHVVGGGVGLRHDLGLADVDADDGAEDGGAGGQTGGDGLGASLLKPIRLISARSGTRRKSRFFGLPGCGRPVTVPISTWSNPSMDMPSMATAFLSKPAARPKGPWKRRPRASVRSSLWRGAR
ncbi:hypothetical protein SF23_01755 [Streptomyces sp. MBRL 10]|nr:hypothetical protein SF23_01755 [Streptomyces sp. MBRL 10]